ncbi:hypothetical protein [Thalassolituus maritimus]|uniref:DUF4124 domain-containing protein n=1 Tax=Thalassolituus maritimus TaxID=484498 RepID=A0ABQ0A119_9GAMM
MEDLIIIGLRMLERLMVVGFGGMSIYLGYKLFFHLPNQTDQNGEIELPGIKVVLSRVGPGVFFLVFGAFILITNLHQGIETTRQYSSDSAVTTDESGNEGSGENGSGADDVHLDADALASRQETEIRRFAGAIPVFPESSSEKVEPEPSIQARYAAIESVGEMNCIAHQLARYEQMTLQRENLIYQANTRLLLSVWDQETWGDTRQLTAPDIPVTETELSEVLNYVSGNCQY